jgi:hypothetical protein
METMRSTCVLALALLMPASARAQDWPVHSLERPKPAVVDPGPARPPAPPPSDAVVLFDGRDLSGWQNESGAAAAWRVVAGAMEVVPGSGAIKTRQALGDVQLHIEWRSPAPPSDEGQDRGNSGVFLMGFYEVQVLDSHQSDTYADGQAAAVYGQYPPLVNATRPPGEWQTYDIVFHRPRFAADGTVSQPARITVLHNGVLVQDGVELQGRTAHRTRAQYQPHEDALPLMLQDHGAPVQFRNVWARPLSK